MHGIPGDGAEFDQLSSADKAAVTRVVVNAGKAIGAYARLLSCGPGRFDRWVHGDQSALSAQEQRGAALFIGRGKCLPCHSGPYFTDQQFHNVGLKPAIVAVVFLDADDHGAMTGLTAALQDPLNVKGPFSDGDDGRLPASVLPAADGSFRTPGLRCVSSRPSFFHTGQVKTLDDVLGFFNGGGNQYGYPGTSEITPLGLSPAELLDLVAFLKALDGPGPDASLLDAPQ
jgi:cytochrome c peroxidase